MMRAMFTIPIAMLAMLALAPPPAAATAITYDFSGTLAQSAPGDPGNNTITGQFTIDFDTQTITAFDFQTPAADVSPSTWNSQIYTWTPAVNPADNFVSLAFFNEDGVLALVFRTTLGAFDGSTFYTGIVDVPDGSTSSGFNCRYTGPVCTVSFGSLFVSGVATPHTTQPPADPPAPTVPEPASLTLLGGGLVALAGRLRGRRVLRGLTTRTAARATVALAVLGLLALAPSPAAATAITYDFNATLDHGPVGDPGNTAVTGQFTLDFDTATITAFDFLMPGGEVDASHGYITYLFTFTPAVSPADNFVSLVFEKDGGASTLVLLFRATLGAFDGNTFYTGLVEFDGGSTGSGWECRYTGCGPNFGSWFVSGAATPHTDPPPPTVPEPTSLALLGGGLVTLAPRLRRDLSIRSR
jgi:hypothetical protein